MKLVSASCLCQDTSQEKEISQITLKLNKKMHSMCNIEHHKHEK